MPVTQEDIAKKLGVSQRLVSYALNGQAGVGVEMRQRIQQEAELLGYRPHRAAQALVTGRTYQVALCFPQFLGSSFYGAIISEFEILARNTPYDLLVITVDTRSNKGGNIRFASDGTIFIGPAGHLPRNCVLPAVVIQNQVRHPLLPGKDDVDRIQFNLEGAAFDAMRHLIGQGFKRIAYIAHAEMMDKIDWRYHAYITAMQDAGLEIEFISLPIPNEEMIRKQSHQMLRSHFAEHGAPEALFCCNDDLGMGAYRALGDLGFKIPDDTAVIGFDDLDYVNYLTPPMSSVRMPLQEGCRMAWEMLMERIENKSLPPRFETLEARFIQRKSSIELSRHHLKEELQSGAET